MKISIRRLIQRLPALALAGALALAACTADEPTDRVYRHSLPGVPADLDPSHGGDRYSGFMIQNLYQTLYAYRYLARPYRLKPELAADFPEVSADALTYRFQLRPGQRFDDDAAFENGAGREVTAADVVYTLKRHFDPATRSQGLWLWRGRIQGLDEWAQAGANYDAPVAGLKIVDRYVFELRLRSPYPQLIHTLANPLAAVVAREAVEHYGREFAVHPVGSGPYRLQSFDSSRALLRRNPNYAPTRADLEGEGYQDSLHQAFGLDGINGRQLPILERVSVDFIPDDSARWLAFNSTGGIDFLRLPADQVAQVLDDPEAALLKAPYRAGFRAALAPELGFVRLDFNMGDLAIGQSDDPRRAEDNRRLRCALAATVDWDERNRVFYQGMGEVLDGIIPLAVDDARPRRDRGANAMPAMDSYPATAPPLTYGHLAGIRGLQEFDFFRDAVVSAGYPEDLVSARSYPTLGDLVRAIGTAEVNVYLLGWVMDYPDAINNFELFYGPNAVPGANYSQYRNPRYDALFEQASGMAPSAARGLLLDQLQEILDRDCVTVAGLTRRSVFMYRREVAIYPDNGPLNGTVLRHIGWRED